MSDLPPLRDVIRRHGLFAKKSLGQNFLLDLNLTGRIARAAAPLEHVHVVEIGPGPGGLTRALLLHWLPGIAGYESLTLMFQKEVAQRLAASPRSKAYGRLSVMVQWLAEVRPLFDIPPRAFVPPPKVTSTVLRLTPRPAPLAPCNRADLERVLAAAFGQRRKMLRQSLRTLGPDPEPRLAMSGVPPTARAEELSVEQFCALARAYADGFTPRPDFPR